MKHLRLPRLCPHCNSTSLDDHYLQRFPYLTLNGSPYSITNLGRSAYDIFSVISGVWERIDCRILSVSGQIYGELQSHSKHKIVQRLICFTRRLAIQLNSNEIAWHFSPKRFATSLSRRRSA